MKAEIHVGDTGTVITLTLKDETDTIVNLAGATVKEIIFKPPTGSNVVKAATFVSDGSDGKIKATMSSGDWNIDGEWQVQAHVTVGGVTNYSGAAKFTVKPNL
jgi:hypothetical protein